MLQFSWGLAGSLLERDVRFADSKLVQNDAQIQRCTRVVVRNDVHDHDWYISGSLLRISDPHALVGFLCIHHHCHRLVRPHRSHSGHDQCPTWIECLHVSLQSLLLG